MFLIAPFGGPLSIINSIKNGLYSVTVKAESGYQVIPLDYNEPSTKNLQFWNRFFASIYFSSLIFCCLTLLFYKMNTKIRYKSGIISATLALFVFLVGGLVWKHLARTYLGI